MVKIKDFTLASQNRGGGHVPPRALHTGRPCERPEIRIRNDNNLRSVSCMTA